MITHKQSVRIGQKTEQQSSIPKKRQWEVEELIWADCILMASCRLSSRPTTTTTTTTTTNTSSLAGKGMEQVGEHGSETLDPPGPPQNIPLVKTRRQMGEWLAGYFSVTPLVCAGPIWKDELKTIQNLLRNHFEIEQVIVKNCKEAINTDIVLSLVLKSRKD